MRRFRPASRYCPARSGHRGAPAFPRALAGVLALAAVTGTASGCTPVSRAATARPSVTRTAASPAGPAAGARAPGKGRGQGCPVPPRGVLSAAPGPGKTVALTFDDGPGRSTAAILAILRGSRVAATFFNVGQNIAASPGLARQEAAAGYALGDHSWNHPHMTRLTPAARLAQVTRTAAEQQRAAGTAPCLFRPPFGEYDAAVLALAGRERMAVWLWSVDTQDWMAHGSGSAYWVSRVTSRAEAGGTQRHPVILMHNQVEGNPATVAALPVVIRFYVSRGYRFVAL